MTTPPPYYGPPSAASPFDVAAATAALDRARAALRPDERAALTVQVTKTSGVGAGLVARGPFRSELLATLTRPVGGQWGWTMGGRIAFIAALPAGAVFPIVLEAPNRVHAAPSVGEIYALFRAAGNGRLRAAVKAARAARGLEVRLTS